MNAVEIPRRPTKISYISFYTGLIMLIAGSVALAQMGGLLPRYTWWAIFILIPALIPLSVAHWLAQRSHALTYGARGPLCGGLLLLTVALICLLDLSWAALWPLFIILPGLTFLAFGIPLGRGKPVTGSLSRRLYSPWLGWIGAGVLFLGGMFLLHTLTGFDAGRIYANWWGLSLAIPALGGMITTARVYAERRCWDDVVAGNLIAAVELSIIAAVALFGIAWRRLDALLLIGAGAALLIRALWPKR